MAKNAYPSIVSKDNEQGAGKNQQVKDPWVGKLLDDRYRIVELLGRGGMGTVYRAEHIGISKSLAIKLFSPRASRAHADRQRFEREAFASARVEHPNCVAVSDFGTLEDGTLFMAMELLRGIPLSEFMQREGPVAIGRALHITKHILRGLSAAHASGIIHRDLKPQNVILVDRLGDKDFAKVLDFGLAKLMGSALLDEGGGKLTEAGVTFGTPRYMAPEQATSKSLDHRADLYAASIILYELIAGRAPFTGGNAVRLVLMHTSQPVPPISEVAPGIIVPAPVEELILQGLAKNPEERMATAAEYVDAIDALDIPVESPQDTAETLPITVTALDAEKLKHASSGGGILGSKRLKIGVTTLGVLGTGGLIIALASGGNSSGITSSGIFKAKGVSTVETADELAQKKTNAYGDSMERVSGLDRAVAFMEKRNSVAAERVLQELRREHPGNALVCYTMGIMYHDRPWPREAIKYYRKAIELSAPYRKDPTIISHVVDWLGSRSSGQRAVSFLLQDIGEPAIPYLERAADGHPNAKIRKRAKAVLSRLKAANGL